MIEQTTLEIKKSNDFRVSDYVLELFEKKYPKHYPKKKDLTYEDLYLDFKNNFKEVLFQWVFDEDPWEKEDPKGHTFNNVNDFFNFMKDR